MAKLRDDWDESGSSGPAAVSWKKADPGDTFTGIVVPALPLTEPGKGYELKQRFAKGRNKGKDAPQGLLVFPPQQDSNRSPMTEAEYAQAGYGDPNDADGVTMKVVTLVTDYHSKEWFTSKSVEKALEDPEFVDNGQRRYFIDGYDIRVKVDAALKAIGSRKVEPGMRFSVRLDKREPNAGGAEGETNRFSVKIEPSTPETMKVVDAFIAEAKAAGPASGANLNDPWASDPGAAPDDIPF